MATGITTRNKGIIVSGPGLEGMPHSMRQYVTVRISFQRVA